MSVAESGLTLTLTQTTCRAGCGVKASVFGFCEQHLGVFIDREFERISAQGFADRDPHPCFESARQWREYSVAFDMAQKQAGAPVRRRCVDPCRDCTPEYRDGMHQQKRCLHPETVFVLSDRSREVIGVRIDEKPENWEKAMMGMSGTVVSMPCADAVNETVAMLNAAAPEPRKRGRPRKDQK